MVRRSGDRPAILRSPTWPALAILAALVGAACSAPEPSEPYEDEYVAAMETVCTATAAELDALAQPADGADRVGFALAAASAIGDEAERAREVEPPGATEADHRVFIANTDEQRREMLADIGVTRFVVPPLAMHPGKLPEAMEKFAEDIISKF